MNKFRQRQKLNRPRQLKIRRHATEILSKIGYDGGAVDVVRAVKTLGISLRSAPYENGELAGMLVRTKGENPVIAVNSSHPPNRRRFTIAHELGHFLLHDNDLFVDKKMVVRRRDENSSLAVDIKEVEANQFAAEFLMPANFVLDDIDDMNIDLEDDTEIKSLSRKYKVSAQAMTFRISNLTMEKFLD